MRAVEIAHRARYTNVMSHRLKPRTTIADLAVGNRGQIEQDPWPVQIGWQNTIN